MSTATQLQPTKSHDEHSRQLLWLTAAISPLIIAPVWFSTAGNLTETWLGPVQTFGGLLLLMLLAATTYSDLTRRKIYNWVTYTTLAWAIAINLLPDVQTSGAIGLFSSLYGAAACFAIMLIPYSLARGGAGDVKLATAIGALIGIDGGLLAIAFAYIIAAIFIVGWSVWTKGPLRLMLALVKRLGSRWFPRLLTAPDEQDKLLLDQPIPLAGFFAVATLIVVFDVPAILRSF